MKLILIAGTGAGPTEQAAYEAALARAETSDYALPGSVERALCSPYFARSAMAQSHPGRWAHAALGWLDDARVSGECFIALQDENLERLQRRLSAAAQDARLDSGLAQARLLSRFTSIVCRGDPVCALILATLGEAGAAHTDDKGS